MRKSFYFKYISIKYYGRLFLSSHSRTWLSFHIEFRYPYGILIMHYHNISLQWKRYPLPISYCGLQSNLTLVSGNKEVHYFTN